MSSLPCIFELFPYDSAPYSVVLLIISLCCRNFVDEGNSSRTKVEKARCFVSDHQASIIEQTGTCTISGEFL